MNLAPLHALLNEHTLQVDLAHSTLDVTAELGALARLLLKHTEYGTRSLPGFPSQATTSSSLSPDQASSQVSKETCTPDHQAVDALREAVGNCMFAVAHLAIVLEVDPEEAMLASIARCQERLRARQASQALEART